MGGPLCHSSLTKLGFMRNSTQFGDQLTSMLKQTAHTFGSLDLSNSQSEAASQGIQEVTLVFPATQRLLQVRTSKSAAGRWTDPVASSIQESALKAVR